MNYPYNRLGLGLELVVY